MKEPMTYKTKVVCDCGLILCYSSFSRHNISYHNRQAKYTRYQGTTAPRYALLYGDSVVLPGNRYVKCGVCGTHIKKKGIVNHCRNMHGVASVYSEIDIETTVSGEPTDKKEYFVLEDVYSNPPPLV